ncbi:MAG: TonB-dependent receptor [Bacteroidota bacterium]
MKKILLTLVFVSITLSLIAQTTLSGVVTDTKGLSIPGANVFIEGSYDGTSTDLDGKFSFTTSMKDSAYLLVTFTGFKDHREAVVLTEAPMTFDILLKETINELQAVVITAGTFETGSGGKSEMLKPLDIVTTAGATADISGALNTLPGTQTVGEEGRLFVRGGDGYEATTFIDGMIAAESYEIAAPNVPTRNRFSPFMFSGASFSTGGYSAEYGQGLSSALILKTKETATETRTDLSFITVGLELAHTQSWEASSLAAKIGYFNLDPYFSIIKQDIDWVNPPTSFDSNIAYRKKVGKDGMFKAYGKLNLAGMTLNYEPFELSQPALETQLRNQYGYLNTSYSDMIGEKWMLRTGASYAHSNDEINPGTDQIIERDHRLHFKLAADYDHSDRLFIRMGGEVYTKLHHQDYTDGNSGFFNRYAFDENIISNFLETKVFISKSVAVLTGARTEFNTLSKTFSVDPRISLAVKSGKNSQMSMAFGRFRQSAPTNLLRIDNQLDSEMALHFIANYQWQKNRRTFRTEFYWKRYDNLISYQQAAGEQPYNLNNSGNGYARGLDLFYRDGKSIKNAEYWISYSFLDTERDYRNYPTQAAPTFTSKHNLSIVYKHFITPLKSQIGLTYSFASGRPYNDPNTAEFNGSRTPSYHDLSANISYLPRHNVIVYLSVTNILNHDHIFGYEYRSQPNESGVYESRQRKLPAPQFALLGVFVTLSKSKTLNQLPNL